MMALLRPTSGSATDRETRVSKEKLSKIFDELTDLKDFGSDSVTFDSDLVLLFSMTFDSGLVLLFSVTFDSGLVLLFSVTFDSSLVLLFLAKAGGLANIIDNTITITKGKKSDNDFLQLHMGIVCSAFACRTKP